jgi:hypothetical protein
VSKSNLSASNPALTAWEVTTLFTGLAFDAATSLFHAHDVMIEPDAVGAARANLDLSLMGIISFGGPQLSGTVVLGATGDLLDSSKPGPTSARDWIGELANQLLGRIKNKAMRRGFVFYASPPAVVSGQHLAPVNSGPIAPPLLFSAGAGILYLSLELCAAPELRPDLTLIESEIPHEGDVLIF